MHLKTSKNDLLVLGALALIVLGGALYYTKVVMPRQISAELGRPPEAYFSDEVLALFEAVQSGDLPAVKKQIATDASLLKLRFGEYGTALNIAVANDRVEVAQYLLDQGADLNARGQWGGTPLHWAAWIGAAKMTTLLIERGATIEARCDAFGGTPLLWAAHGSKNVAAPNGDYVSVAKQLIDQGASADTANRAGEAAVDMAAPKVAELLKENGAKSTTQKKPKGSMV